jgi:hypothetical protein
VSETPARDVLRRRLAEHADELAAALPEGYVPGLSTKIPASHRDEVIRRRRAGESRKSIAKDYGCSVETVSRAIRSRLHELGQYDPELFFSEQRRKRAEGWEWMKAVWETRDAENRERSLAAQESLEAAAELQARMEASDREQRKLQAQILRERVKAKRLAEQGLLY